MKKYLSFAFSCLISLQLLSQGMNFEKNTTWEKVVAKAKAENKLIFVDCYTTWCGPCKKLDAEVFPNPEVGEFFNKHFVNLKVQMDTTKNDTEYIREWWIVGQEWHKTYGVWAYPSFLVFDSNGEIADRGVGFSPVAQFLEKGKELINREGHYYPMKKIYEEGKLPQDKLSSLAKKALNSYDRNFIAKIGPDYLSKETNLFTQENIRFITQMNPEMGSTYFNFIKDNPEKIDEVMERKGTAENYLFRTAQQKFISKLAPMNASKEANWAAITDSLQKYFPEYAESFLLKSKISRASGLKQWPEFSAHVQMFFEKYIQNVDNSQLNSFAWSIFQNCEDMACINMALGWAKHASDTSNEPAFLDTYANLLYKSGNKEEAIATQEKAVAITKEKGEDAEELQTTLDKMKKGVKTW
jgi:thioredoxin-related protein